MVEFTLRSSVVFGIIWLSLLGGACSTSNQTERLPTGDKEGSDAEDSEADADDDEHASSLGGAGSEEVPQGTTLPRPEGATEHPSRSSWPTLKELLAEPGWQNSNQPLCLADFAGSVDLVVSRNSVLLRYGVNCPPETLDATCGYTTHVLENSGDGWEDAYGPDEERALYDLQVLDEENFLLRSDSCVATRLQSGSLGTCELEQASQDLVSSGPGRTFALIESSIWRRTEQDWEVWAELPRKANRLFVTQELLVAMAHGAVFVQQGAGEVRTLPPPPAATDYRDLWVLAQDDLWLSADTALFHFNGSAWKAHEVDVGSDIRFVGLEGQLYFNGRSSIGRIEDGKPRVLFGIEGEHSDFHKIHALAGLSPEELFVAVGVRNGDACSRLALFFFDGEQLHAF